MLRLRTFGGLAIERNGVPVAETAEQHKALAVFALVAASGQRGVSRDRLTAYLWPESDAARARGALSQTLYTLRKQLGEVELFAGTRTLRLSAGVIGSDLGEFEQALEHGDREAAVALYAGPFLDGFFVPGSTELERWIEEQRADLARRVAGTLESLAREASKRGDHAAALAWWRRLAALEPGNSRVTASLVSELAEYGDRAGALQVARSHEEFLRAEFEAPPDPAVSALADEIRQDTRRPLPESARSHTATSVSSIVASGPIEASGAAGDARTLSGAAQSSRGATARVRFARVATFVSVLVAVTAIMSFAARGSRGRLQPVASGRRIAVTGFDNETGDSSLASIGRTAVDWVVQGLVQTQLVEVVGPGVRAADLPALGDSGGRRGVGLIVRGSYSRSADSLLVQAQVLEAATGRVVRAVGPVSGPLKDPLVAIERLRQRLVGALATKVDPRLSRWSDAASQPASFEAYRALDEGLNEFFSADDSSDARAGRLLVHAGTLDTTFSLPLLWALYAFGNAGDPVRFDSVARVLESRRERLPRFDRALLDAHVASARGDAIGEYDALRRVVASAPNSEWVYKLAVSAMSLHRFAEADSLLRALDPDAGWMREYAGYWARLGDLRYSTGQHAEELAAASRWQLLFPRQAQADPRQRARALAALGRDREFLALVDDAIGRSPQRIDPEGLFRIMSAARVHGHLRPARAIAQRALRGPINIDMGGDSLITRARYEVLVLEATEMWEDAAKSARRLLRADSLAGRHDALPYMVLLQAALRRGAFDDTAGLEARARAEVAARPKPDAHDSWTSESRLAVEAELAALHHDARRTAAVLSEAVDRGVWEYYWYSERPAFDAVRGDSSLARLLHNPATDRRPAPAKK
jgi:DNA-binding SARP family transcriptional activator/TolB-like protein